MLRSPRVATPDDAATLAEIARETLVEAWSEESIRAALARPGGCALVIDPALGFVLGGRSHDEAEILTLAVAKDARGRGLGRALVVALLDRLQADGARSVSLEVRDSNVAAAGLYVSLGFRTVRVRRSYYRDGEDALALGLTL